MTAKTPEPFPTIKDLPLDTIRLDGGTQPRAKIDTEVAREYAERMQEGDTFPPVQVYFDGVDYWLSDGFHRVRAAQEVDFKTIQAEVWEGTRDDALWMSLAANKEHGLRRSNDDKARAVKAALAAKPRLGDRQIAEHVGVHFETVAKYRAELKAVGTIGNSDSRTGRDGRTIRTAKIGKRKARSPAETPDPDDIPMDVPQDAGGEQGAPATPVTDKLGHPVEGAVADAFRRRHEIQALMLAVSKVKSTVLKAIEAKDPLFADILASRFQADCNNVRRQLRAALPHAACPYCRAAGCKACNGRGWIGEFTYNAAPKELKA